MIVTKTSPLENLETLGHVEMVCIKGKLIEHPRAKHLAEVDEDLDQILHEKL